MYHNGGRTPPAQLKSCAGRLGGPGGSTVGRPQRGRVPGDVVRNDRLPVTPLVPSWRLVVRVRDLERGGARVERTIRFEPTVVRAAAESQREPPRALWRTIELMQR